MPGVEPVVRDDDHSRSPPDVTAAIQEPDHARAVGGLTAVNTVVLALGVLTGPLQARALGVESRGELAAILVPLALVPAVLDIGLTTYIARERARGTSREVLLGTLIPVSLGISMIGVLAAYPLAHLMANGRSTALTFLLVGFLLSPLTVGLGNIVGIAVGEGRWRVIAFIRIAAPLMTLVTFVALYATGALTVATAALTVLIAGFLAHLPLLSVLPDIRRWRYEANHTRSGLRFGSRVWAANVTGATAARFDQLLMVPLVSSRQLGLYAVAVTVAGFAGVFVNAVSLAVSPDASRGNAQLVRRFSRTATLVLVVGALAMAVVVPVLLPLLFGPDFRPAVPMVWVLLIGTVASGVASVLSVGLIGSGHPGYVARAVALPLAPTIPIMFFVLPSAGAMGAAWISAGASVVGLYLFVHFTGTVSGAKARELLVPTATDVRDLVTQMRRLLRRHGTDRRTT